MTTRRAFVAYVSAAFAMSATGCLHEDDGDVVPLSRATVHEDDVFRIRDLEHEVHGEIHTEAMPSVQVSVTVTNHGSSATTVENDFVLVDEDDEVYRPKETSGFEVQGTLEPGESAEYVLSFTVPADRLDRPYYFGREGSYVPIQQQ